MADEILGYTESVKVFEVSELKTVFNTFCKIMPDVKGKMKIEDICFKIENDFSSHSIKTLSTRNKNDGFQIVKNGLPVSPGMNPKPENCSVVYPNLDRPDQTQFIKFILAPIKVGDVSKSFFDHMVTNDENSESIFESFKAEFGVENFEKIKQSVEKLKAKHEFEVNDIKTKNGSGNIPIVFVPYKGEHIQVTPLTATYDYAVVYRTVGKNPDIIVNREYLTMSCKPWNIDPVIGNTYSQKLMAKFPKMLSSFESEMFKNVKNGTLPRFKPDSYKEFGSKIDGVINFYNILEKTSSPDVKEGMIKLIKSIIIDIKNWYEEIKSYVNENYPEQELKSLDIADVLLLYTANNKDHNFIVNRMIDDGKFEKAMKEIF